MSEELLRNDEPDEVEAHSKRPSAHPSTKPALSEPTDELEDNEVEAHSKRPSVRPSVRP